MEPSIKNLLNIDDKIVEEVKLRGHFEVSAPSNIALIKYWGKKGIQLPKNPSLSFTLDKSKTFVKISFEKGKGLKSFFFEGEENEKFGTKIFKLIDDLIEQDSNFLFLKEFDLKFETRNTFPHSAGIASSAASMAAVSVAVFLLKLIVTGKDSKLESLSSLARIGSGSACRSLYSNLALWGETSLVENSSNEFAIEIHKDIHPIYKKYGDAILLVSKEEKEVSSRVGHELMNNHPYAEVRYKNVENKLLKILKLMRDEPTFEFCELIEAEALELHALMMMSSPSFILMKEKTLTVIEKIKKFRKTSGIPLCFTLDAGPNIHLLYPLKFKEIIVSYIENELKDYLVEGEWIDDQIGLGPVYIK